MKSTSWTANLGWWANGLDGNTQKSADEYGWGGNAMVGNFSLFQRLTVTPTSTAFLEVEHTLGVAPKLVIVKSETTASNKILSAVYSTEIGIGCYKYTAGTSGSVTFWGTDYETASTTDQRGYFGTDKVYIRRASSTRNFNTGNAYTVEIYA